MERKVRGLQYDFAVVGLGYVGLPLAIAASRAGLSVLGIEIDDSKVQILLSASSYIDDISRDEVAMALASGFTPTNDASLLAHADAVSICVPTPLRDHRPDLSAVEAAATTIALNLQPGQLVVLESTSYPGTTEEIVKTILEENSEFRAGRDFYLAYSPERIDPGNPDWGITNTPKVVGGFDVASTQRAAAMYEKFCDTVITTEGTREAEMSKLLENTYRHVNIALVNEMAILCRELGINLHDAIRAAATKPFGFEPFYPGPGVGGHCIPIDPNYLSYKIREAGHQFRFVELAQEINAHMPRYVVQRVSHVLNSVGKPINGSRILLLGVAYKPNVSDTRNTPAREIARMLISMNAEVSYVDPLVTEFEVAGKLVNRASDEEDAAHGSDLVIVLAPHRLFDLEAIASAAPLVLDTRGLDPIPGAETL